MPELRSLLARADRAVSRMPLPSDGLERLQRRRDRKRRNQRIAAGVVGLAVFVAAIVLVASSPFERTGTPAVPGPTAGTGPSVAPDPDGGRRIGLPPEGADPSSPERGELVITYYGRPEFGVLQVLVYADGRVIWREEYGPTDANGINTGFLEQRLTPEGVELLRSEVISSGLFDRDRHFDEGVNSPYAELIWGEIRLDDGDRFVSVRWGANIGTPDSPTSPAQVTALVRLNELFLDLASVLPASAWEDPEVKAYVPSRYAICYSHLQGRLNRPLEPSEVLNLLPTPAEDLLLGRDRTYQPTNGARGYEEVCSEVTTEEARLLEGILRDAGSSRHRTTLTTGSLEYAVPAPAPIEEVYIRFEPVLPHGQWSLFPG
jgi:hypothetical protein